MLEEGWEERFNAAGKAYYIESKTGIATWDRPTLESNDRPSEDLDLDLDKDSSKSSRLGSFFGKDEESSLDKKGSNLEKNALIAFKNQLKGWRSGYSGWCRGWKVKSWHGITIKDDRIKLELGSHNLAGKMALSICDVGRLRHVDLSGNQIAGPIPDRLGSLKNLHVLLLQHNEFSGSIPLAELTELHSLNLSHNNFDKSLTSAIGDMTNLTFLDLSNNKLVGNLNESIGNCVNLTFLNISENKLSGSFPSSIDKLVNLRHLDASCNVFSGTLSNNFGSVYLLKVLNLGNNQFSGEVPLTLRNLEELEKLYINDNSLTGEFPEGLCDLFTLTELDVSNNQLTGTLPTRVNDLENLVTLLLNDNSFSGNLCDQIGNLVHVERFECQNNSFEGSLPVTIGNMVELNYLNCNNNQFSGPLPDTIGNLVKLCFLDVSDNNFEGPAKTDPKSPVDGDGLPEEIGCLVELEELQLHHNKFSGKLPEAIGKLTKLTTVEFHHNDFKGKFPPSTSNWKATIFVAIHNQGEDEEHTRAFWDWDWVTGGRKEPQFDKHYKPWKQTVTTEGNPVTGFVAKCHMVLELFMGYADLITDILSALVFYYQERYFFFGLQIFFFMFPCVLLVLYETDGFYEQFLTFTQLRLFVETYRSIKGKRQTARWITMKIFESVIESFPSTMLQLVAFFGSDRPFDTYSSALLLGSAVISSIVMTKTLFRYCEPTAKYNEKLSIILRMLYHFAEVWLRTVTFVLMFMSVGVYGFILLGMAILIRGSAVYRVLDRDFDFHFVYTTLLLTATECVVEWDTFAVVDEGFYSTNTTPLRAFGFIDIYPSNLYWLFHILSAFEGFIPLALIEMGWGITDIDANRKIFLVVIMILSFAIKTLLVIDRKSPVQMLNGIMILVERPLKLILNGFADSLSILFYCCFPEEEEKNVENKNDEENYLSRDGAVNPLAQAPLTPNATGKGKTGDVIEMTTTLSKD